MKAIDNSAHDEIEKIKKEIELKRKSLRDIVSQNLVGTCWRWIKKDRNDISYIYISDKTYIGSKDYSCIEISLDEKKGLAKNISYSRIGGDEIERTMSRCDSETFRERLSKFLPVAKMIVSAAEDLKNC